MGKEQLSAVHRLEAYRKVVAQVVGTAYYHTSKGEEFSDNVKLNVFSGFSIKAVGEAKRADSLPSPLSTEQAKNKGIALAQIAMRRRRGPEINQVVAHPSDKRTYLFVKKVGEIAFVMKPAEYTPDGIELNKQFPVEELFSPDEALDFAKQVFAESENKMLLN